MTVVTNEGMDALLNDWMMGYDLGTLDGRIMQSS